MTHEELQALAGAYALGALDGEELDEFRAHLPGCWECRQAVLEFEEVYAEGSLALPPVKPDPQVKGKLLARISGQGPVLPASERAAPAPAPRSQPTAPPAAGGPSWAGFAAAALLVSTLLAGWAWIGARAENARLEGRLRALERQAGERTALAEQVARLEDDYRAAHARLERLAIELKVWRRLLEQPEARVHALRGTDAAPGAVGRVLWSGKQVALIADALPALPSGQVYELWAISGEQKIPAGLFPAGGQGSTLVGLAALPDSLPARVDAFALTPEPEAGVEAPTGAIVLLGQVQ